MRSAVVVAVLVVLLAPALARSDPFSEFRIPDHSWRSGSLGVQSSGSWSSGNDGLFDRSSASLSSSLSPQLTWAHDSDSLLWSVSFYGDADGAVRGERWSLSGPGYDERSALHSQNLRGDWAIHAEARSYPGSAPLGVSFSGSASGRRGEGWSRDYVRDAVSGPPESRDETSFRQDGHDYSYGAAASIMAGVGRVRDATVVYDAYVLEERLLEMGAITRPLSPRAREKLAALGTIAGDYSAAHDRPARYYWRDVERILREDGVLGEHGLDAYGLVRIQESYRFRIQRERGWFAGPIAIGRHEHFSQEFDGRTDHFSFLDGALVSGSTNWTSDRFTLSDDELDLGGDAELHLPLDWNWQLDVQSQVTAPARDSEHGLHATSLASLIWLIADRWQAVAAVSHNRDYIHSHGSMLQDSWQVGGELRLGWYVEDHVQLTASVAHAQSRLTNTLPGHLYGRETSFSLGLTHRFLGALDAAGLIEPVRPI
jgi:hypothetical protein